jgi:hypothetical protein
MSNILDSMSIIETDQIDEKVQKIMRQTDYSQEIATEKLKEYGFDEIATIKAYLGVPEKKTSTSQVKSVNQEIYKQLRNKLDSSMRDYQGRVERGEVKKVV